MILLENHVPLKTLFNLKEQRLKGSMEEDLAVLSSPLKATCKAQQNTNNLFTELKGHHGFLGCDGSEVPKALSLGHDPGRGSQGLAWHATGTEVRVCITKVGLWVSSPCYGLAPGRRKVWEEIPEGPRPGVWGPENFQS